MIRRPLTSPLFPYTTLFRSQLTLLRHWGLRPSARVLEIGCGDGRRDRKSTRLNSSHDQISYAVFCLKKKKYSDVISSIRGHAFYDAYTHPLLSMRCTILASG